jgi:hypothetical protein
LVVESLIWVTNYRVESLQLYLGDFLNLGLELGSLLAAVSKTTKVHARTST